MEKVIEQHRLFKKLSSEFVSDETLKRNKRFFALDYLRMVDYAMVHRLSDEFLAEQAAKKSSDYQRMGKDFHKTLFGFFVSTILAVYLLINPLFKDFMVYIIVFAMIIIVSFVDTLYAHFKERKQLLKKLTRHYFFSSRYGVVYSYLDSKHFQVNDLKIRKYLLPEVSEKNED